MTTNIWLGRATAVAQISTATPGGTIGTETFTLTVGGKSISYTATGGDVAADVVAGLLAAWEAAEADIAEIGEITATDTTGELTLTGETAGYPFTVTGAATGSATLVIATPTAATGPNHVNDTVNWSQGSLPANGEDVVIGLPVSLLYGLDALAAVTVASLVIEARFTATIGLPETNANGYPEYRGKDLQIGATVVRIGVGDGDGSGRIRLNLGSVQSTIEVRKCGQPLDTGIPAVTIIGTHASNAADCQDGSSVGFAFYGGTSATLLTLRTTEGASVVCGEGCTLGTVYGSGSVRINSAVTTLTQYGGTWETNGTGTITTLTQYGGLLYVRSSGTVTTATIGATVDCSQDASARTFTTTTLSAGGVIRDPLHTITFTNAIARGTDVDEITAA